MDEIVGYCKECGSEVSERDLIPDTKHTYECPVCEHPHAFGELWSERPSYIPEAVNLAYRAVYGKLSTENTEEF